MDSKAVRISICATGVMIAIALAVAVLLYLQGRPTRGRPQYVAMGSSYAAGPGITKRAADSPWFCARSADNYAHQLARTRGLSLVDVSCSGATTGNILDGGFLMLPPQIDAVTAETELVTITIGGNDIGYIGNLMAMGCRRNPPWYARVGIGCKVLHAEQMQQALPKVYTQLLAVIDAVRDRSPQARIVLLNYQTVLPENGTCKRLDLSDAQVSEMRGIAARMAAITAAAARQRSVMLMDAATLTRGHDVCAEDSWMTGMHPSRGLLGAPLHPNLSGMAALAHGLNILLGHSRP